MTETCMSSRVVHSSQQKCTNTDRSRNLFDPYGLEGNAGTDGSELCAECCGAFDDPGHGEFAHCKAKTAHACKVTARTAERRAFAAGH
jgi:hypothetical protein